MRRFFYSIHRSSAWSSAPLALAWVALLSGLLTGCSVRKMAVNKIGDALAGSGGAFGSDDDPELIKEAAPFGLKLVETLLLETPRHPGLLLAAASRFTQHSYAFIQQEADRVEDEDLAEADRLRTRATRLYLRARDYGLRGLELRHPGASAALRENPEKEVLRYSARSVPFMYWTAAAWSLAISLSKDDPEMVADLPIVEALIDRALALDPEFEQGALYSFLISYEPARIRPKGDPYELARQHFHRAMALSEGKSAGPLVALAESVSVMQQNRAEFESLLGRAINLDVNLAPSRRLENIIAQNRARWLLGRIDQYFLDANSDSNSNEEK